MITETPTPQQGNVGLAPMAPAQGEIATAAATASAVAAIQARFAVARANPRHYDQARVQLLRDCHRPRFAAKAHYHLPRGGTTVSGVSIRFVEAAMRAYTNLDWSADVVYETATQRMVQVVVTDLEANLTARKGIMVNKTIERKFLKKGQVALSQRVNSQGDITYLVQATEADCLAKTNAEVSKALRELALRMLPGDLVEEAEEACWGTLEDQARKDPDSERKKLVDAFVSLGVQPVDLEQLLRHPITQCSPAELVRLREVYTAIRDGQATWADYVAPPQDEPAQRDAAQGEAEAKPSRAAAMAQKVKAKA